MTKKRYRIHILIAISRGEDLIEFKNLERTLSVKLDCRVIYRQSFRTSVSILQQ